MADHDKMMSELKGIDTEMAAYAVAMQHADDATFEVMASHVNELFRKRCRAMGLPEEEIARIERESETATALEIAHAMTCGVVPTSES
jgi:hypothetical protein